MIPIAASARPRTWKWRATYLVTLGAAVAATVAGIALASGGSGTGSATTGSVSLSVNAPATSTCHFTNLVPGSLTGSSKCSFSVNYVGSISAFVSLSVGIQSTRGHGANAQTLYNPTGAGGLTFTISDGQHSFTVPAGVGLTGGACPASTTCWSVANDLAAWYSGSTPNLTFTNASPAVTWTVTPNFPAVAASGNAYQGGSATLTLTAQAVQAPANPLPSGCTTSTIGAPCAPSGTFTWS